MSWQHGPSAVAVLLVALLGLAGCRTGGSSDGAKSAAAAQVKAYREAVRPVLVDVFAQVEPVQEAYQDANKATGADYAPIEDVVVRGRVPAELTALRTKLAALTAPSDLTAASTTAGSALEELAAAVSDFPSFAKIVGTEGAWRAKINAAKTRMDSAAAQLNGAVALIFPTDPPPVPTDAGIPAGSDSVTSRAGFLLGAARTCSPAARTLDRLAPAARVPSTVIAALERAGSLHANVYQRLLELPLPERDAAALERTVRKPLTTRPTPAEAAHDIAAAARARDRDRANAAQLALDAAGASARTAAAGLRAYGSLTCAEFLSEVGVT